MGMDYGPAQWIPSPHFDAGRGAAHAKWFVFHGTASGTGYPAEATAHDFQVNDPPTSTHYVVGWDGTVVQCVRERDTAWGNGPITAGAEPWFLPLHDANPWTISCETSNASDNSLPLSAVQGHEAFALCLDVCRRNGIPLRPGDANGGIVGHKDIDPVNRSFCPGTHFPWAALWDYLAQHGGDTMAWTAPGAEAISEFARQHSGAWKNATCVEAAALMCAIAEAPADAIPAADIGDYLAQIVALWQTYGTGVTAGGASSFVDATRWLRGRGFTVDENVLPTVGDWWAELQDGIGRRHCVYLIGVTNAQGLPGDEAGVQNHGLCGYGVDGAGNIICGDPDNLRANVNMPGDPIGASVVYTRQNLVDGQVSSLTRVHPMSTIPAGWTDDGTFLTAPTGHKVRAGFRDFIRNNPLGWLAIDQPLGDEEPVAAGEVIWPGNGDVGPGSRQAFRLTILSYTPGRGVFRAWPGNAIQTLQAAPAPPPPAPAPPPVDTTAAKVAAQLMATDLAKLNTALAAL